MPHKPVKRGALIVREKALLLLDGGHGFARIGPWLQDSPAVWNHRGESRGECIPGRKEPVSGPEHRGHRGAMWAETGSARSEMIKKMTMMTAWENKIKKKERARENATTARKHLQLLR